MRGNYPVEVPIGMGFRQPRIAAEYWLATNQQVFTEGRIHGLQELKAVRFDGVYRFD